MSFLNETLRDALFNNEFICSKCGGQMEFEDEWEDSLVCPSCGHCVETERYGMEDDEAYEALYEKLYPTREEVLGIIEEDDDLDDSETYDEVCGELDDYCPDWKY